MIRIIPEAGVTGNGKPRASGDDPAPSGGADCDEG